MSNDDFTFRSSGDSVPSAGSRLTSRSHGRQFASSMTSKPRTCSGNSAVVAGSSRSVPTTPGADSATLARCRWPASQNAVARPAGQTVQPVPVTASLAQRSTTGGSKKRVDRNSDEYRRRRERNNVAVRKSREKAKVRSRETEDRVKILARENERLQKKVELLQEELAVLRSLFSNVGVLPDHIHRELSKHIDNFQQQHTRI